MKRTRLNPISKKRREQIKNLANIKKDQINEQKGKCFFCGKQTILDQVHIIRRSASLALIDNPFNVIMGCRVCHTIFDDHPIGQVRRLGNIDIVLERMKQLDPLYYERYTNR